MALAPTGLLQDAMLETFRSRAAGYDRDNRFFQEDFDDLRAAGYLRMAVPKEFGGLGYTLADVARETRRVATFDGPRGFEQVAVQARIFDTRHEQDLGIARR